MKNFTSALLLMVITLCANNVAAQIVKPDSLSHWKKKFVFNLNVNQAAFSSNWKAGGINSIGVNSLLNYKAGYKKNKISWDNEIDLLYGFVNNKGQGYRKTLDRIFLDTKYGYELNENWGLFTSLNFLSQFAKGYKYGDDDSRTLISDAFAPAFITSSWGLEYHPVEYFKIRISPFSPRITILRNNDGRFDGVDPEAPYGVEVGDDTRFEWLAFQLMAEFDKDIATNLNLKWRYMMFANYETLKMKTIDHRLDLMFNAKINRFITVGLGGILIYDFDQDSGAQLSQAFNFGFAYSFQNYKEPKK
jgi:Protein of unknown function (DUF3078)